MKGTTAALMISVALFFDTIQFLLEFIPILGQILSSLIALVAFGTFYLWFKMHGLNFATPKRAGILGGGFIIELIPFLNALPTWTLAITLLAIDSKVKKAVSTAEGGEVVGHIGPKGVDNAEVKKAA